VSLLGGEVTQSVVVSTQRAAGGQEVLLTAVPGRDVVVLHIDGGQMLVLHPENARDLMLAQGDGTRASAAADAGMGRDVLPRCDREPAWAGADL
jgi:hypothetical protein